MTKPSAHAQDDGVWVCTGPDASGVFRPILEFDADTSYALDLTTAPQYAMEILRAVAIAEYEAAVIKQLRDVMPVGEDDLLVIACVAEMREDRPDPSRPLTPLRLIPGVSAFTGEAFLTVEIHGKPVGQWSTRDARQHVLYCLLAVHVAELDSAYLRFLRGGVDLDEDKARFIVGDLASYRGDE